MKLETRKDVVRARWMILIGLIAFWAFVGWVVL